MKAVFIAILLLFTSHSMALETTSLLNDSADTQLQQALEGLVEDLGLTAAVQEKQLSLALVIVTDPVHPRMAELNGRQMVYAASLPKIAILLGAAVAISDGRRELNESLRQDLNDMIRHYCNQCASRVLEQVGRQQLKDNQKSKEYRN